MDKPGQLTITLHSVVAAAVRTAVDNGEFASASDAVDAALRDWANDRAHRTADPASLESDVQKGLEDVAAGRVKDFDLERIMERGRTKLKSRSPSA